MRRGSVATLLTLATLAASLALRPGTAAALSRGYGRGAGYCSQFGNHASGYSYEGVYACATTFSFGPTTFDSAGSRSFQCVELSARFLWAVYGIWAGPGSGVQDGADFVSVLHASHPSIDVGYPGRGYTPVAGDIVSLGPGGAVDPRFGHTAVVVASNRRTGRFTIMSQNLPPGHAGERTASVDLTGHYPHRALINGVWTVISWLELRPQPPPPSRPPSRKPRR
jgi:CHAP domain